MLGNFVEEGLRFKTKDSVQEEIESILIVSSIDQEEAEEALVHALVLGETAKDARRLVNLPPSHLYPETFAEFAAEVAEGLLELRLSCSTTTAWLRRASAAFPVLVRVRPASRFLPL